MGLFAVPVTGTPLLESVGSSRSFRAIESLEPSPIDGRHQGKKRGRGSNIDAFQQLRLKTSMLRQLVQRNFSGAWLSPSSSMGGEVSTTLSRGLEALMERGIISAPIVKKCYVGSSILKPPTDRQVGATNPLENFDRD
jgi:hypothetical protein